MRTLRFSARSVCARSLTWCARREPGSPRCASSPAVSILSQAARRFSIWRGARRFRPSWSTAPRRRRGRARRWRRLPPFPAFAPRGFRKVNLPYTRSFPTRPSTPSSRSSRRRPRLRVDRVPRLKVDSPQSELKGKRDENSDRRCERCDRPAAGSSPESEPACGIRTYAIARVRTRVEGNWRGTGHRRRTGCRCGEGRRRTDPARRRNQRIDLTAPALHPRRNEGSGGRRPQSPSGRQHQPACGASRCGRAPLPAAKFRIRVCARRGAGGRVPVPFISTASPGVEAGARTYLELEARASATPGIELVALRYGFFYGPGTWYTPEGDMGDQVRQQQVPIIGEGQGVYSFVHIDDAAGATFAALECPPGAYNIVDGNPSPQHVWLPAFARAAGAPAPLRVSEEEALRASGPDPVYYATRLRGASNEKVGRELEFRPRPLEWI